MNELEELRHKRLEQLQQQQKEVEEFNQQISTLEQFVRQHLTKEALSRYGNLKAAHPEKAVQALTLLAQIIQTGKLPMIDDKQLKDILQRMQPPKREFKITRQ
ncbi:MAG: DNA-binding protein [Nanoarchaeota archaeon]|nr:DNA-binding protein [Nanoarchaeota archaeon]